MGRFGRFEKFEVKNEMRDGGTIRTDDYKQTGGSTSKQVQEEIRQELENVGFDDWKYTEDDISDEVDIKENTQEQNEYAITVDDNGNPVIPQDWTFLIHGSSEDRWDTSLLGNDFVVGNGKSNGADVKNRPLCCVEKSDAKFNYERRGSNTAKAYGGKDDAFEIRVVYYKNPRLGDGEGVRKRLNSDELKEVTKCYMYQDGRHPAIPSGTKLVFLKNSDFDEITNTNGNNILWYIPEQYLEQYLSDVEQMKNIVPKEQIETGEEVKETDDLETKLDEKEERRILRNEAKDIGEEEIYESNDTVETKPKITNLDIEQELEEYYDDSVDIVTLKAYLKEKIPQVYGDRLEKLGIDIDKYLENNKLSLEYFEGAESYKEIAKELESYLDFLEEVKDVDTEKVILENRENEDLETKLDEKDERRTLRNEARDTGEEIFEQNTTEETSKSVSGRDILSSAIEATEETTRTSTINEQVSAIRSVQKEKTQQQDKTNNGINR